MGKKKGNTATKAKPKRLTEKKTEKNVDRPAAPIRAMIREIQYLPNNSVTIEQVLEGVRALMSRCLASEEALYEAMCSEAEGWEMRLDEIKNGDYDDDDAEEDDEDNG